MSKEIFKKIDREFKLGDSSLNCYSFRMLTSGYLMGEFLKNPIGYYMHGTDEYPREMGVLVKWEDLRLDGDSIVGKPCINMNHPRGQRTVEEIESGFLNAASFGQNVAVEISNDPADYLPGQTGPTLKKWYNRECSLVDIPGNYNAVAEDLVDINDKPINLADYTKNNFRMKQIILTPAQLAMIPNLKAEPSQADVDTAIADLVAKAAKTQKLEEDNATLKTEKADAEQKLTDLINQHKNKQVEDLIAAAQEAKKITVETAGKLSKQYAGNPDDLKDLLSTLKAYQPVTASLTSEQKELQDLVAMSYDDLDKTGKLENLKALSPTEYFGKFEGKFNRKHHQDPTNK